MNWPLSGVSGGRWVGLPCKSPADAREAVFAELLEANLLGQGTGAAPLLKA